LRGFGVSVTRLNLFHIWWVGNAPVRAYEFAAEDRIDPALEGPWGVLKGFSFLLRFENEWLGPSSWSLEKFRFIFPSLRMTGKM
jgi:hypothetical protein